MAPVIARSEYKDGKSPAVIVCLMASLLLCSGCVSPLFLYSKPHVDETGSWRMYEACGYEGCAAKVGILTGEGIRIRIEAFNYHVGSSFSIRAYFIADKNNTFSIDPSKAYVVYPDGAIAYPKAFRSRLTQEELNLLKSKRIDLFESMKAQRLVTEPMRLDEYWYKDEVVARFSLEFEAVPPPPEDEFFLFINGLKKEGKEVDIPKITFLPAIRRGGGGKLIPE